MGRWCWVLVAAACHGGTAAPTDAPLIDDAPPDASDPEAARVEIKVLTEDGSGELATGAIAVFRDPADQVIQAGPVDADAVAFAYLPAGGSVTVLYVIDDPMDASQRLHQLTTIRGVKPGDRLQAGIDRTPEHRVGAQTGMTAAFTPIPSGSPPFPLSSCGRIGSATSTTISISFIASCLTPTFDLLTVYDGNDLIRRYVWQTGIAYAPDGVFTIPNSWQPMAYNTTTVLNVPANLTRVFGTLYAAVGGNPLELQRASIDAPSAGTQTMSLMYAPDAAVTTVLAVNQVRGFDVPDTHVQVTTGSAAAITVDLGALPLPQLGPAGGSPTAVGWSQTGAISGDARLIHWVGTWTDANAIRHAATWHLVEAPDANTSSLLPSFPAAYAADDPTIATGWTHTGAFVQYVDYDNLDGYDAARPYGFQLSRIEDRFLDLDHHAHRLLSR